MRASILVTTLSQKCMAVNTLILTFWTPPYCVVLPKLFLLQFPHLWWVHEDAIGVKEKDAWSKRHQAWHTHNELPGWPGEDIEAGKMDPRAGRVPK
jgi:hypothetical protein